MANPTGKINAANVNLLDDSNLNANVTAPLPQGTAVEVIGPGADDTWLMVAAVVAGEKRLAGSSMLAS